jgi:PAS domain-containing protein
MTNIINVVHHNFEQLLKNSYTTTLTLAMTIDDNGIPQNFDKIASKFVNTNNSFDAVQLVPNGVISYIYPLKGNEGALGYDVLKSPNLKQDALKSIQTKLIHFAGPLELRQGGIGVVGRLPIFKHNKFWGFSAVMIRMETLLKTTGIQSVDESKYYFQFSKINPNTGKEEFFLANKSNFKNKYFQTISIPDGDWKLYLIARDENGLLFQIITSITLGFLLCVISALWITSLLKKPAKLELLIQEQSKKILDNQIEFKAIFEQAPAGIAKVNSQSGDFIAINKTFCELVGYSPKHTTSR